MIGSDNLFFTRLAVTIIWVIQARSVTVFAVIALLAIRGEAILLYVLAATVIAFNLFSNHVLA